MTYGDPRFAQRATSPGSASATKLEIAASDVITSWPWGGDDLLLLEDVRWTWARAARGARDRAVKFTWAPGGPPSSLCLRTRA